MAKAIDEIKQRGLATKNRICVFRDTLSILLEAFFTTDVNEWNRSKEGFSIMNKNFFSQIND